MSTSLQTTSLGEIHGIEADGVTKYLGIKYANLKNRLADAELIETREGEPLDATSDGPTSVSPEIGCDLEQGAIQQTLPEKDLEQSDLHCLNLNIAVPSGTTPSSKLPVFVYIHGGGFTIGANSWPQFDSTRLAKLSAEKGLPTVLVTINYRLGVFGFLTSNELRQAGFKSNNGVRDQRVALKWIQRHIRDFGGDPENVTVAGESAGGGSVTYHLHTEEALFKRAVVMSGTFLVPPPAPRDVHETNYLQVIEILGLKDAPVEERIKALLEAPAKDLANKLPLCALPAVDGDTVQTAPTFAQVSERDSNVPKGKAWCEDLLVGDTQMDASIIAILMPHTKKACAKKFVGAMHAVLSPQTEAAQEILDRYGIKEEMPDDFAYPFILNFLNDLLFAAPTLTLARGWQGNAYVYYFNEGNPWDGPWEGQATHILDVAYLFQNFSEFLTPAQQAVGTAFAEDIFRYCHGVAPWPAVKQGEPAGFTARIYGPSELNESARQTNEPFGDQGKRRSILFDYGDRVSLDDLTKVFTVFKSLS